MDPVSRISKIVKRILKTDGSNEDRNSNLFEQSIKSSLKINDDDSDTVVEDDDMSPLKNFKRNQ